MWSVLRKFRVDKIKPILAANKKLDQRNRLFVILLFNLLCSRYTFGLS